MTAHHDTHNPLLVGDEQDDRDGVLSSHEQSRTGSITQTRRTAATGLLIRIEERD